MNIIKTDIEDLLILEPRVFGDNRGWFTETYSKAKFQDLGIDIEFVQDNHYGYSKEQGEKIVRELIDKHFIVRTSWVYGSNGNNFVRTMLKLAESRNEINVVSDQIGAPTYSKDLADFIINLVMTNQYGIYHDVNEGYCSWYEFAKTIFEKSGIEMKINPISTKEYPTKAARSLNSKLSKRNTDKAGINRLPHWEDAISRFISDL